MEVRAYHIICHPAMVFTWICGLTMLYRNGLEWLAENGWMHIKLGLLILLTVYHFSMKKTIASLKQKTTTLSSYRFRLLNEIPTLFLFAIVPFAVFKNGADATYVLLGIIALMIFLSSATKMYRRYREKNAK